MVISGALVGACSSLPYNLTLIPTAHLALLHPLHCQLEEACLRGVNCVTACDQGIWSTHAYA
jgi:hypothetical protein